MKNNTVKFLLILLLVGSSAIAQNFEIRAPNSTILNSETVGIVKINAIGFDSLTNLTSATNDYIINSQFSITPIHINYTVEGYTTIDGISYQGLPFFIINGRIYEIMGSAGHVVFNFKSGANIVTLAYLLANGNTPMLYQDTIRIFINYTLTNTIEQSDIQFNIYDNYSHFNTGKIRDYESSYPPKSILGISWNYTIPVVNVLLSTSSNYNIYESYNQLSFESDQQGLIFMYDAVGLHLLNSNDRQIYVTTSVSRLGNSSFGILSVAQLGSYINQSSFSSSFSYDVHEKPANLGVSAFNILSYSTNLIDESEYNEDPSTTSTSSTSTSSTSTSSTSTSSTSTSSTSTSSTSTSSTSTSSTSTSVNSSSSPVLTSSLPLQIIAGTMGLVLMTIIYRRKKL